MHPGRSKGAAGTARPPASSHVLESARRLAARVDRAMLALPDPQAAIRESRFFHSPLTIHHSLFTPLKEETMANTIRRVVTGHDKNGKAIVLSDGPCTSVRSHPNRPGHVSTDVWKTTAMPVPITSAELDPTQGPRDFVPPMGTKIRISIVPPEPDAFRSLTPEQAREFFKEGGNPQASTFAQNGRHPFMHRTESVDYAVVLEGEITMLLDEEDVVLKAGDVVIQRGTNHAWSNRSGKPVKMLYILIDGTFAPELAQYTQKKAGHK